MQCGPIKEDTVKNHICRLSWRQRERWHHLSHVTHVATLWVRHLSDVTQLGHAQTCLLQQSDTVWWINAIPSFYRVETLMGFFQATKNEFFSSFFIPCSGVYVTLPCGERKFIAHACLTCYSSNLVIKLQTAFCLFMICSIFKKVAVWSPA